MKRTFAKENDYHDLCTAGSLIPSVVGSDQGWYFIRRIAGGLGSCAVYEVRDDWKPKRGWVTGDDGEIFFTKPFSQPIAAKRQPKK